MNAPPEPKSDYTRWYTVSHAASVFTAKTFNSWAIVEVPGGWKTNGDALMGYGDANLLARSSPNCPPKIGAWLKAKHKGKVKGILVVPSQKLFIMPTKPAVKYHSQPYVSWKNPDSREMVSEGLAAIREVLDMGMAGWIDEGESGSQSRLVLRPPGTWSDYGPLPLRVSLRLIDEHLSGLPVTVVSKKLSLSARWRR